MGNERMPRTRRAGRVNALSYHSNQGVYTPRSPIGHSRTNHRVTERAFRCLKGLDLLVRPIRHRVEPRVRAHVLLCMLAYYVEWHMRARLKPMLFDDEHLNEANASRASPVAKAVRSEHAKAKDASKLANDGLPLHSFRTLLKDLGTLTYNIARTGANPSATIAITSRPTPIQDKAFKLLAISPNCSQ